MTLTNDMFKPGMILHEVLIGAFKSKGTTMHHWCIENGIKPTAARCATYGQSGGKKGSALLERLIDAAGRDVVSTAYRDRIFQEAKHLKGDAA